MKTSIRSQILGLLAVFIVLSVPKTHAATNETGDSILNLGDTGYAKRPTADVSDLDYAKDFSIEGILNIEPNTGGGRWAHIISKASSVYGADAGFSVGLNQGMFQTYGQNIYAKIGDGSQSVTYSSPSYQGIAYFIVTWNIASKTMNVYVNGELVGTKTNTAINPSAIQNTQNLFIGRDNLKRDILMARIWNREISESEEHALYDNYAATKQTMTPAGFNRADLKSEWLMRETSDSAGNTGTTHLKDTAGGNHLELLGGAKLLKGDGNLTMIYPANNQQNVSKSVFLRASGGSSTLGGEITYPLQYSFQIDERNSFDSSDLKESGWIQNFGMYKPILKPGKTYFWRVKVRDSASTPHISSYSPTQTFQTQDSQNWYVRPGVYDGGNLIDSYIPKPLAGTYGSQNGTSYSNAWNGLMEVKWGEGGVSAGDNLFVCGRHLYTATNGSFFTEQAHAYIKESGYSDEYPITIRMDCPQEAGEIWGAWKDERQAVNWSGPDANGVYSTTNLAYGAAVERKPNGEMVWLNRKESATWEGDNGSAFNKPNDTQGWLTDTSYVKPADGSSPAGRIFSPGNGWRFDLSRAKYIKFLNGKFFDSVAGKERYNSTRTTAAPSQHITFDGCVMKYGGTQVPLYRGHDYWTVKNCDISDAGEGIYTMGSDGYPGANFLTVQNTKIHDIGTSNFPSNDCHCIGVQGGEGHLFEHNEMWNGGGDVIEFWSTQDMKNMTVRYNYIHDIYARCLTSGGGIGVSGDNVYSQEGERTGYKIHHNITVNVGLEKKEGWQGGGIGSNNKDPMEVYNNIVVNPNGRGIGATVIGTGTVQGKWYNNIVINQTGNDRYIQLMSPSTPNNLYVDNNLYYPLPAYDSDKLLVYPFVEHDQHSVFADPQFVGSAMAKLANFALRPESPAIDKGKDVDLAKDMIGTPIPQGAAPDIGAFEYSSEVATFSASDINQDYDVNVVDLGILMTDFLKTAASALNPRSDINSDGAVNVIDLGILMSGWE